ncbi:MAG: alpha/beta hydrolase [Pseudomonadota bacterium]
MSEKLEGADAWRQMDAAELARQYNARATVSNIDTLLDDYRTASAPMYEMPHVRDIAYGPHADERLDLFPVPGQPDAPLFVFIHGGYWRAMSKEDSVFMAKTFVAHGIAVASVNYQLAPAASLEEIVAQCRRALGWLHAHAAAHGAGTRHVVVAGSSAGGHLAAMLAAPGWQSAFGVPADIVKGAVLVSGLFDLAPVQQTTPNDWLKLDVQRAVALSPIHALPPAGTGLCVAAAGLDTDEFKRQSVMYAHACSKHGCRVDYLEVAGRNHFDVIMDWMDPQAQLTRETFALLAPAA